MIVLSFPDSEAKAAELARELGVPYAEVGLHRFPDGESKLTLPEIGTDHVVVFRGLDRPGDKLVELLLTARSLREGGVTHLSLVAPYLCYMRQDWAFEPGEVVSQRIIGGWLAELFDDVVTVDPHLHRIERLEQAVPARNPVAVSAAPLFARYLRERGGAPFLVGPDAESEQWVKAIAAETGLPFAIGRKTRYGDRTVRIEIPDCPVQGRAIVLVDDIASTGATLAGAAAELLNRGAGEVSVLVTHPVFVDGSAEHLFGLGVSAIGSSDSIVHPTNVVSLAPVLAEAVRALA